MKVRCIDNENAKRDLTIGREYEVLPRKVDRTEELYLINNNKNEECSYFKNRFEPVEEPKKGEDNMKFKVGDKVRVIRNGLSYTTYSEVNYFLNQVKNPKPYNYNVCIPNGEIGVIKAIKKHQYGSDILSLIESGNYSYLISLKGIEFIEPQTEFTFQEVIARIKEGEVYISTKGFKFEAKIDLVDEGLRIRYFKDGVKISRMNAGIVITHQNRFKLQEPKKRITIYKVEHKQDGKKYDFISSQLLQEEIFVVCDTTQGKSYGRVVDAEDRELTEEEMKQYKECWRA